MSSRKLTPDQLRKFRSDIASLKSKGLLSKRVDARSQKPTRYMRSQIKKFSDVLSGKAAVVKAPRSKAKEFSDKYIVKGNKVVVPKRKGETVSYSKSSNTIVASSKVGEKRVRRRMSAKAPTKHEAPLKGNVLYVIPLGNTRQSFDTWSDLVLFMEPYENNPKNPYKEWMQYVEIVDYDE